MLGMPPLVGLPSQPPAEHSPNSSSIEKLPGSEGQDEREEEDKVQARSWLAPASSGLPPPSLPRSLPAGAVTGPGTSPVPASSAAHLSSCRPSAPARVEHLDLCCSSLHLGGRPSLGVWGGSEEARPLTGPRCESKPEVT